MKTETDQSLQQESLSDKAHRLIPGGCHTYAKGDDQFPSNAPRLLCAVRGAASGTRTGVNSSSTAWDCGRSRSGTRIRT